MYIVTDERDTIIRAQRADPEGRLRRNEYLADLVNLTDLLVDEATDVAALDRIEGLSRGVFVTGVAT